MVAAALVVLLLAVVIIFGAFKLSQGRRHLTKEEIDAFLQGDPAGAALAPNGIERALRLPYVRILRPEDVVVVPNAVLGSGEFGVVHLGIYKSESVAIKTFKRSIDMDEFKKVVLAEVKMMAYLGDHENIVKFLGAEISEISQAKIRVVTELSPHGDLLHFLWKVASVGLQQAPTTATNYVAAFDQGGVTVGTLYGWCEQISSGMEHLTQKQIVHGDLAARNVLVFEDQVVKISDFGMSKSLYGNSLYRMKRMRKLPWRGASIELLASAELSEASDVWAFGVTVWEIFTLGQTPYQSKRFSREFIQFLQAGNRLPQPSNASDQTYKILLECWDSERENRPDFRQLKQAFHDIGVTEKALAEPEPNQSPTESTYITAA